MARFIVADDNAAFRALAARVLADHGHQVAGEAADAREAVRLARTLSPDAILLDVHFGAADGWTLARTLALAHPTLRVIMTSSDPDAANDRRAHRGAGVRFVDKEALATEGLGAALD